MGSIGGYVFRTTMGAFAIICICLTVFLWFTQAMRDFDLITTQRQTLFVFFGLTGLLIPMLVMMIAPLSLLIAAAHVLNRLSSDSEIVVMNAAGVSPWRLVRPLLVAGLLVSLLVFFIAAYLSPLCLRELRQWGTQVRADILTNIVQPGRFTTVEGNMTFHIADRRPNGLLVGIFVDDRRNPNEHITYLAEQGQTVKNANGTFLVLEHGSIQRVEPGQRDPRIVTFDRDAFDLSKFTGGPQNIVYGAHERYIWELLRPTRGRAAAAQSDQYRSELNDRLATFLYPLVFVILGYAFLGQPQTTRQNRTLAAVVVIVIAALLRLIGFLSVVVGADKPAMLAVPYVALFGAMAAGLWQISRGKAVEAGAALTKIAATMADRRARSAAS